MSRFLASTLLTFTLATVAAAQPELTPPGPPVAPPLPSPVLPSPPPPGLPPADGVPPNALPANALPPNGLPSNALPDELPAEEEGVEPLTQGPIHEAFADPATPDPEPSALVTQQPPADVPEQPAAYKPEGDFDWIPGYWDWDDDDDRYLWVTGVWRQAPPDMRWVPGYWNEVAGGWQRVKGFWVRDEVENVTYYNQPPATLEAGPSSPAPATNYFWIPGSWNYVNTGFTWQAGYWAPYQPDWVYTPSRWIWTPAGYVFVPGYWDYRMGARGQIFAPVYFRTAMYNQPGWTYRPSIVIPTSNLFIHLWVRPTSGCYYFGNYYGPRYASRGFIAWSNLPSHNHHYHYDPFYSYARVHYRQQGVDYLGRVQGWHNYYAQHPEHRPPPTFREQKSWLASPAARAVHGDAQLVARPIAEVARKGDSPVRLAHLDHQAIESQAKHAKQIRDLDVERRKLEREHTNVSINRPGPTSRDLPGREGPGRERDKGGSLVDRVEKGDRPDKSGGRGDSKGPPKSGIIKGDQELAREARPGRLPTAGDTVQGGETAKIALPKVEKPKGGNVAVITPEGAERPQTRERVNAPPLPNSNPRSNNSGRQNTNAKLPGNSLPNAGRGADVGRIPDVGRLPNNGAKLPDVGSKLPDVGTKLPDAGNRLPDAGAKLPDVGRPPNRSTFGTKTGDAPRGPNRVEEPKTTPQNIPRNTGREGVLEPPPGGTPGTVRSGQIPGRGAGDAGRGAGDAGRGGGGDQGRRSFETPGFVPPGKLPDQPRTPQPTRELPTAGAERSRPNPNAGNPGTRDFNPPSNSRPPANTNRDRGGPRNDQPTFKAPPKVEAKAPASVPTARSGSQEGGSSSRGKKKGND